MLLSFETSPIPKSPSPAWNPIFAHPLNVKLNELRCNLAHQRRPRSEGGVCSSSAETGSQVCFLFLPGWWFCCPKAKVNKHIRGFKYWLRCIHVHTWSWFMFSLPVYFVLSFHNLITLYLILKWKVFPFPDQTPTPTRFLKNCEEVGLFSELDCSIEQEFCKAQEEEDSKQVKQLGEQRKRQEKQTPNGSGGSALLSGAVISHVIIKASSCTWAFDRWGCLIFPLLTCWQTQARFVVITHGSLSSKVESERAHSAWVGGRKCSSSAFSAVKDEPSSCRCGKDVEKRSSSTPVTSNRHSSLRTGVLFLSRMQLFFGRN